MARYRSLALAVTLAACALLPAAAQGLQRLTVTRLTLSASTLTPQVEVPFDLVIEAHVKQQVTHLENLDLPVLAEVELLGDENSIVAGPGGSTYTERIRVVAHHSGTITIDPVTLDAIDARDGKAKRYSSNALTLNVQAAGLAGPGSAPIDLFALLVAALRWLFAIALVVFVVAIIFVRRRRAVAPAPVAPPEPVPAQPVEAPPTIEERLSRARELLQASPTRTNVLHVRTVVREMVGANDAETLDDVLRRIPPHDVRMRSLLRALERAAFTHDDDFRTAAADVIRRLEEMT